MTTMKIGLMGNVAILNAYVVCLLWRLVSKQCTYFDIHV